MTFETFLKGLKNAVVVLGAVAGAIASLEKLSHLELKAGDVDVDDSDE